MTALLASVASVAEGELALAGGADLIDLKAPTRGALGAVPLRTVRAVAERVAGRRPVSATIGDHVIDPAAAAREAARRAAAGADFVKVGFFAGGDHRLLIRTLEREAAREARIVAVLFADQEPDFELLRPLAESGFVGAMLDTARKGATSLRRCLGDEHLGCFVHKARALGLRSGLAGSLAFDDVAPLLGLGPDYLGFRGALCVDGQRAARLDPAKLAMIRAAIPSVPTAVSGAVPRAPQPRPPARTTLPVP